jgi:hypothetical protein
LSGDAPPIELLRLPTQREWDSSWFLASKGDANCKLSPLGQESGFGPSSHWLRDDCEIPQRQKGAVLQPDNEIIRLTSDHLVSVKAWFKSRVPEQFFGLGGHKINNSPPAHDYGSDLTH